MMLCNPTKSGCKKDQQLSKQSYLIIWALTVTLNLKTANLFSCMTLGSMRVHYHTKSGYKRFSHSGDIVEMNIHWNSEPFLWPLPSPQRSNPVFSQDNPVHNKVPSNQIILAAKVSAVQKIYYKVIFDDMVFNCDLDLEDSKPTFFIRQFGS